MFLVVTRNFPPDVGGMQILMGGLSESLLNHGPVKVFANEYPNSNIYDSKSAINIERVKGIKLFKIGFAPIPALTRFIFNHINLFPMKCIHNLI